MTVCKADGRRHLELEKHALDKTVSHFAGKQNLRHFTSDYFRSYLFLTPHSRFSDHKQIYGTFDRTTKEALSLQLSPNTTLIKFGIEGKASQATEG